MKRSPLLLAFLAAALVARLSPQACAQATLTTLFTNGPTANRINLVVLSEGYTASQLGQFLIDARGAVSNLLATLPYREYSNYFNAFAISVPSAQSGSDHHTPTVTLVNTYFNSTYDSYGTQRLITIPPNDWDSTYADGQGKVDALLQSLMPEYDLVILLVNDPQYGGSGGTTLISSLNSSSAEIVRHESGHTFGVLADEYTNAYPGYIAVEKPNATAQTSRPLIKWVAWIDPTTPVPTPQTSAYALVVALFQGAEYQTTGWYRPKLDCKMNHLGTNFCEVCGEQLVKSAYGRINSIDSFSPVSTNLLVTSAQPVPFAAVPLQPATHTLTLQWFMDGTPVTGATNSTFNLQPQLFANGSHTLRAQVLDATTLVRSDPSNLLSNSVTWTVNISLSQMTLVSSRALTGGCFAFSVTGTAPRGFVLQASTNLLGWNSLSTNWLVAGRADFTNSDPNSFRRRFYRAQAVP
jgi:hypothetical protein